MSIANTSTRLLFRRSLLKLILIVLWMIFETVLIGNFAKAQFKGFSLRRSYSYILDEVGSQRTSENTDGNRDSYSTEWKRSLTFTVFDSLPHGVYSLSLVERLYDAHNGNRESTDKSSDAETGYEMSFDMSANGSILRVRVPQLQRQTEYEDIDTLLFDEINLSTSDYYKDELEELLHIYPENLLSRGSAWKKTIHRSNPFSISIDLELKLASETDSSYIIAIHGKARSQEEIVFGSNDDIYRFINIDILVSGTYSVDRQTGWFIDGAMTISILSELSIPEEIGSDTNIPLTVTEKRKWTGRIVQME